ncbi:prolyl oligopeptidase family serine peptidase [Actinoallomurus sp. NPDC052308]|uniref:S9 family peptidase n=1 Tax=Actinoallomurus sp. NPDC052308 TaxID=3155530 RepID=UPI003424DFB5
MTTSFPRQSARTRRFTLGAPRGFLVSPDGSRVVFLRTRGGTDPVTCLWALDVPRDGAEAKERLIVDPRGLDLPGEEDLPAEERARRERAREQAGGIVTYATDEGLTLAAFALSGRLFVTDLGATVRPLDAAVPAFDPRPDPTGAHVAYVSGRALRVIEVATGADRALAEPEGEQVSYGLAEFIAAEEMQRMRGYWWAPDGTAVLAARVDESPVRRWHIADPANPGTPAREVAYPAAGTPNADVSLFVLGLDGARQEVEWDRETFPYLVTARWDSRGVLLVVQTRDQKTMRILAADPSTGRTTLVREDTDPVWLDIVPGAPARTGEGDLVWVAEDGHDARGLIVGGERVTPDGLHVRAVLDVDGDTVLFTASEEPTEIHVWAYGPGGLARLSDGAGVYGGRRRGGTTVVTGSRLDRFGAETTVLRDGALVGRIASHAEQPSLNVGVTLIRAGERELRTAVLLPTGHTGDEPLPVLMDPYGGPHAQRVLAARRAFAEPQWLADQGFAVVVADGRGSPGRGHDWERAIHHDLAGPVLDDQIAALRGAAERFPLDLSRVAIRGWSFGGYLAALAVLRRPDVFHAAIAGAPVTDWTLYDTHYTERYLGDPGADPEPYERSSLFGAVSGGDAPADVTRPLLLIHGLADDNVVAAHTLRLSSALLAAGRPHAVLPLSGVTHMTPQEVVAENLLLLQIRFLKEALA